jgi:hypothetical protein
MNAKKNRSVLVIIGAMMFYTGFNYVTTEKIVDIGLIEINKQQNHPVRTMVIIGVVNYRCVRHQGYKKY